MNNLSFQSLKLKLISPEEITNYSHGEVTKPETINYRTQKPEKDGLFCEKIFGPEKDWECYCGKYRKIRYKGIICDKCGVEVTRSIVRRERMGHIKLAAPVAHIWFLRSVPSRIGLVLNISLPDLEKIIYFASYVVTKVDEVAKEAAIEEIKKEFKSKSSQISDKKELEKFKQLKTKRLSELNNLHKMQVFPEMDYIDLSMRYGHVFEAAIGAEAVRKLLEEADLHLIVEDLRKSLLKANDLEKPNLLRRLRLIEGMIRSNIKPEWEILNVLPVLPPDLRPMVALDGGRYATSDLNDLYRRVINRNNRLKRLLELNAPEVICRNEKRMLQEAVDALIDNSARRGQGPVMATTGQKRQLKSLADILRGKQGRFRQNLLGKRVDYSGRSVIVVGPDLKLDECGLPKRMALELFKPFVIRKLVERELVHNVRGAGRLIEQEIDEVWEILEEITKEKYVLLNRAPTLHRLGVQAFKPVLIEGSAIQIHPMVCQAFNADFDGDQMAVHLPLTDAAQLEAKEIMLSTKNLLKPSTGQAIVTPTKDMILGAYWMTKIIDGLKGEGKIFANAEEAILTHSFEGVDLRAKIKFRLPKNSESVGKNDEKSEFIETSVGRIIFNQTLPVEMGFANQMMNKKNLYALVGGILEKCGTEITAETLDKIKKVGFEYATLSGVSWGMDDIIVSPQKKVLIEETEVIIEEVHKQYLDGLLTREERKGRIIEIWSSTINKISKLVRETLDVNGPVFTLLDSQARGSWAQVNQMAGMKGLVVNPAGEIIELPVKSSFKEGLDVLEYFISTHGARKGTADTALRTSKSGYLTRRLVDVAQDVIVKEEDCGDSTGIYIYREDGEEFSKSFADRLFGRFIVDDFKFDNGESIKKGELVSNHHAQLIDEMGVDKVKVRSVISCKTNFGICQKCYGVDLGHNKVIGLGIAAGIITAQAIGEPGTQLTMRTFHTGGIAGGGDITQGLPRVEEIFEARKPKTEGIISEVDGRVMSIREEDGQKAIKIEVSLGGGAESSKKDKKNDKGDLEVKIYPVPNGIGIWVNEGDAVKKGQQLSEGHLDLKKLFKIAGQEALQRYVLKDVQNIYSSQGEGINDKHIEIIVHQMLSRIRIKDSGDTNLLIGSIAEKSHFNFENEKARKAGKKTAVGGQLLLGISKVSLSTESWLSAASFQETTRVLIEAALQGKEDNLMGLKENVIIGKLIPAGTGFKGNKIIQEEMEKK